MILRETVAEISLACLPTVATNTFCIDVYGHVPLTSAKNSSVRAEWLRQSGHAQSQPSETPRWRITPRPVSTPRVGLHIALQSLFHRFFLLRRSPIGNEHSGVGANCDYLSEWVHWVQACIGIAMRRGTLQKSLLTFLLPMRNIQIPLYYL